MEKARILIVEDEAIIAMEVKSQLYSLGYEVTSIVNNGKEAIMKIEIDKPDLILMDIRIKGEMDGIETAEVIRNQFGIPVIFSTAYLDQQRIERLKITMPFGYVLKPIQERDLKVTIEMALYVAKIDKERKKNEELQRVQLIIIEYAIYHTIPELLQKILDEVEILTGSQIGFFHFIEEDQLTLSLQMWSSNTLKNMCDLKLAGAHYPISEAGVWVDCVKERKPVIHNDYSSLSHKKGIPEGHTQIIRELVVPVYRDEKIKAILGVGNKKKNYDEADVKSVQFFADLAWETVVRKQVENALSDSEAKYRLLFEDSIDGRALADPDTGIILDCNQAFANLIGRTKQELIGQHQRTVHPPAENEGEFSSTFKQHIREKSGEDLRAQIITKSGEVKDVNIRARVLEMTNKKIVHAIFRIIEN